MYAQKHSDRASAGRQTADALLRALGEHTPDLTGHLARRRDLAAATAEHLGLGRAEVERIRRAAELHDIGKIGIPGASSRSPARSSRTSGASSTATR